MNEPEILLAAKQMMIALRNCRDFSPEQWDALLAADDTCALMNAWDRLKTAIVTTEKEVLSK